ncbi:NADPH-dependent ferric siderophore reductase, contains FAD-binding and SIP domains [Nannocystis exedens]|uniref:NADPH-dependent ferric siderophore reductase, contains FAD-binding and SIP domains n=1 Tax=Nannocystis exedens TaxID=54 RepID=A0A1I2G5R7_9BACT|nr:siderophore-interacting protein [Nannocystis exedens]PCC67272.1 NADPH-dependent ferric siderophore reductase [Nannocystis exedens]SFF12882.1 NADPH-dependent ferric siderophore reductase, contains FAD-binding and SIP domains [Nannocystis exedens]
MASVKAILGDAIAKFFPEWTIAAVRQVSPHFRRIDLTGDNLRAPHDAGDKVQVWIPGAGARTYTPFSHRPERGAVSLLVYLHGEEPGAQWGRAAAVGERVRVFGPRGSLPFATLGPAVVLFGDETSFAAARALRELRGPAAPLSFVFEVTHADESEAVLAELDVGPRTLVPRGEGHLVEVERRLRAALDRHAGADLVLCGNARSIQTLRAALKAAPAPHGRQKVKAYWAPGKRGLD